MAEGTIETNEVKLIKGLDMNVIYQTAPIGTMSMFDCSGNDNTPSVSNRWFGFQWKNPSGVYGFQIAFSFNNDKIYKRFAFNSSTLSSWREI